MLTVRAARGDDRAFVHSLIERFLGTTPHWRTDDELISATEREFARAFDVKAETEVMLICEDARGERLGFAWVVSDVDFFTGESHAHVSEIAVTQDGTGAGRALMEAAEKWAIDHGDRYISLNVQARNVAAHGFYLHLGYSVEKVGYAKPLQK
ncbi:MAG: GNAT family N-acetyltransferase [Vulcanimicrobiaceae bacterium]